MNMNAQWRHLLIIICSLFKSFLKKIIFLWKITTHLCHDLVIVQNGLDVNISFLYKQVPAQVIVYNTRISCMFEMKLTVLIIRNWQFWSSGIFKNSSYSSWLMLSSSSTFDIDFKSTRLSLDLSKINSAEFAWLFR